MKVVYSELPCVTLTSKDGKTYDMWMQSYEEVCDEIRIRTSCREREIKRGWIGNLSYNATRAFDMKGDDVDDASVADEYSDVLLAKLYIYESEIDQPIVWEYVFLKK